MAYLRKLISDLQKIKTPGHEEFTFDLVVNLMRYHEITKCPFDWSLEHYKTKPMYLDELKKKKFHIECEGTLRPFLLRIMATVEFMNQEAIEDAITQISLGVEIYINCCKQKTKIRPFLFHLLITTISRMLQLRGYVKTSLEVLILLPMEPLKDFQIATFSGLKAIICSYYGLQGQVEAIEYAVGARLSTLFETEWRFVMVVLIVELYDLNVGEEIVSCCTAHMGYEFHTEPNKPANTFAEYFRVTWESRDTRRAISLIHNTTQDVLYGREPASWAVRDRQVIRALEVDPLNREILESAATYYGLRNQVHKALALFRSGRNTYRCCAEGHLEALSLTFPDSGYLELEENLNHFNVEWSLPIVKRAALLMLASNMQMAITLAFRAFKIDYRYWLKRQTPFVERVDKPLSAFGRETTLGFYKTFLCVAKKNETVPASHIYLKHVKYFLRDVLKTTVRNVILWDSGWKEVNEMVSFKGMKKITLQGFLEHC